MYRRLNQHFYSHNIFAAEHYGFGRGLSTANSTPRLTEIIFNTWSNNRYFAGVVYDLAESFDYVNH
jgi:hypothetical protein